MYIFELFETFVLDLVSAAIHPQVFIIWGSQDPSTKYALAQCQYALSSTRDLIFQHYNSVFIEFVLPPVEYIPEKHIWPRNSSPNAKAYFGKKVLICYSGCNIGHV